MNRIVHFEDTPPPPSPEKGFMTSGADFGAPLFDDEESKIQEDSEQKEAEYRYLL